MRTYEVIGRPLRRNGRLLQLKTKVRFDAADGDVLVAAGRLREAPPATPSAKGKAPSKVKVIKSES